MNEYEMEQLKSDLHKLNHNDLTMFSRTDSTLALFDVLLRKKVVEYAKNGKLRKLNQNKLVIGKVRLKGSFGFLLAADGDYYVREVRGILDGDYVLAILADNNRGSTDEVEVLDVINRETETMLVKIDKFNQLIPLNEIYRNFEFEMDREEIPSLFENQIIKVKVTRVTWKKIYCDFMSIVANANDPDLQMKLVLAEFEIETEFPEEAQKMATALADYEVTDFEGRTNLTNDLTITIDGADAKDLDDAISLIKENENYRLKVSIADVSYFVEENSVLDQAARSRSTSVYFIDRVVPMLPKEISNGICSLHPNVLRYTQTCEMLIDPSGNVLESSIYPSVIKSKYRMTYEDVNKMILDDDKVLIARYQEIYGILKEMNKLAHNLNKKRLKRGAFNLEDKEPKFTVDERGKIVDVEVRVRRDAEKLIEEFMIVANETVASSIDAMEMPFIYRIHKQPTVNHLNDLFKIFPLFNLKIKGNVENFHVSSFKEVLDQIEDPVEKRTISDLIVRAMQKAIYSADNDSHFGLASPHYTHFTSPIRRYPDLIVHRLLRRYLFEHNFEVTNASLEKIANMASYASEKEVKAIKAEQKIEDQKKAEYMKQFIGQQFNGIIASIADFGFFVELENTQRGLVRFSQLADFSNSINYKIYFRNGQVLALGQKIDVKLISCDVEKGLVDFEPVGFRIGQGGNHENKFFKQKSVSRSRDTKNPRSGNRTQGKRNKVNQSRKRKPKR
ncbi:MAG: ribonuclease R [Mycoplasmatales bacterium]